MRLKKRGAEVIHLGWCLCLYCPFKDIYIDALKDKIGLPVIEGTHSLHRPPSGFVPDKTTLYEPPPDAFPDE
jgi:Asp/Glu/hydantoin racemase